jgi:hypothetical protein
MTSGEPGSAKTWWSNIPAVVKQATALITAVAALLGSLVAAGVIGGDGNGHGSRAGAGSTINETATALLPVVVRFEGKDPRYAERGFFTPQGFIVSTQHALASTSMVAWTDQGRSQEAQVALVRKGGADVPGAVLFKLAREQPPRSAYEIRNAQSLRKGEPVIAYLGAGQSTPGQVVDPHAQVVVPGYGTVSDLIATTSLGRQSEGGAPLLDSRRRLIGMLFAGGEDETVAIRIEAIRAEFPAAF